MNKKFSTLAVAAMLASAFTAYAGPGDVVTKLAEGNNQKQYQLRVYDKDAATKLGGFLVLDKNSDTGDIELKVVSNVTGDNLGNSLWCVDVTLENQGKNPIFDFINKGQKAILDVTAGGYSDGDKSEWIATDGIYYGQKVAHVGGEVAGWEFTPVLGSDDVPMFGVDGKASQFAGTAYSLNSYIDSNMAATLVYDGTSVKVAIAPADKLSEVDNQVKFFLQEADAIDLTADQFNSILNTQNKEKGTVKLTFNKDYNNTEIVNPFSTNELRAINNYKETNQTSTVSHNFVNLYKTEADGTKNYLRVDTAYANGFGTKFLTFAFGSEFRISTANNTKSKELEKEAIIPGQYKFRLNYCPTDDSLSIQVMSALYKLKDDVRAWSNLTAETAYGKLEAAVENEDYVVTEWNDTKAKDGESNHPSGLMYHQTNWVKLQDLETSTESRIITVGDAPINTHISFGFGGCSDVKAEYTSVADGVYVIKNAKGQVLASPIYKGGTEAMFVSVDEQDPQHMPAYQWVVLTNYTQEKSLPTSPVTITNREFPNLQASMQLREKEGAEYMYALNASDYVENSDSLKFEKVADTYVKDKYLGYKKITKDSLTVNKYTFNYWHPYASDKFIAKSSKDSTLTVLEGKDAFVIDTVDYDLTKKEISTVDIAYGFTSKSYNGLSMSDVRKRIPGLAQLVRTVYEIKDGSINDKDATIWKVNKNDQFNLGDNNYNEDKYGQIGDSYYVFFKENNHIDGKHYYALVRAISMYKASVDAEVEFDTPKAAFFLGNFKAGVSDYDAAATLKNQPLYETRTSSFAIDRDDTPLYRRFNSAALEGQAGDGVDTLRFYEKYRNEYLMIEANTNFMVEHIDFLGIDAQDKAQGGLAFIVDTAWVNRGAGNIKPQYLISIDRHDKAGTPGVPCTYEHNHYDNQGNAVDAEHCSHATPAVPGFARGKYLINFQRFVDADKDYVKTDDYKWAGYVRAGFKEAVVVADTLYILRDEFKNLPNEEITVEKLASAEVEAQKAYSKEHGNLNGFLSYKYELAGDNHKEATWSMRFVDREKAANEVEADRAFLIESMADEAIAPMENASWLKMQNGCLVLSKKADSKFNEVVTGGDDALIFNVEHVEGDQVAVDNENIAVEGVSVVAGNGQVTIMGAAGKNVTITNILGKVIANQTITSDNATIAVPAGIVAVAVEGEAAVKAIVK